MKIFKISLISFLLVSLFAFGASAQSGNDLPPALIKALKTGNTIALSSFFSNRIELTIQDKEAIYSKSQASQIMAKFFREYPPSNFKVKHAGGKPSARYVIGSLQTSKKTFRVNFLLKSPNGKPFIHQLRIETSN